MLTSQTEVMETQQSYAPHTQSKHQPDPQQFQYAERTRFTTPLNPTAHRVHEKHVYLHTLPQER